MSVTKQNHVFTRRWASSVLKSSLIVAILDGLAAVISAQLQFGIGPQRVFQYIASGLMGQDAYSAGLAAASFGLLLHWLIALTWSGFFFLLFPKQRISVAAKVLAGILVGLVIYITMQYVVVPLSLVAARPPMLRIEQALIHIFFVGIPISFSAARFRERQLSFEAPVQKVD